MNSICNKVFSVGALILPLIATFSPLAEARGLGGWAGSPISGGWGCFSESDGAVVSSCSSAVWEVPLPVDADTTFNPSVATSAGAFCETFTMSQTGAYSSSSGSTQNTNCTGGTICTFSMTSSVSVPYGGYLYLACTLGTSVASGDMDTATTLASVNW